MISLDDVAAESKDFALSVELTAPETRDQMGELVAELLDDAPS